MWRKLSPNGLTQKRSGYSGSRTVMWPATPSPKPKRPKMRNAPASFCLRWTPLLLDVLERRRPGSETGFGVSSTPSIVLVGCSVTAMTEGYPSTQTGEWRMNRSVCPAGIAPPAARYAHAVVTTAGARLLHSAGVVPVRPDGTVPDELAEQAAAVWANIAAILAEAGMSIDRRRVDHDVRRRRRTSPR